MIKHLALVTMAAGIALAGCTFELSGATAARAACGPDDLVCAGQILAEARCARCHATGTSDLSPYPGAQPFRAFWRRWTKPALASALKTGIIAEHDQSGVKLPEMKLESDEIKAFFAYLDTIHEK